MSAVRVLRWGSHAWSTKMVVLWAYSEVEQRVESWCRSAWEVWSRVCSISASSYPTSFCQPACVSSPEPSSAFQLLPTCPYLLHSSNIHSMNQTLSSCHLWNSSHPCRDEPLSPAPPTFRAHGISHIDKPNGAPREVRTQRSNNSC